MPGRVRSVLLRVEVRRADRLCYCKHDKRHRINKGDLRLVIKEPGPASGEKGYCAWCGRQMLSLAAAGLSDLQSALD